MTFYFVFVMESIPWKRYKKNNSFQQQFKSEIFDLSSNTLKVKAHNHLYKSSISNRKIEQRITLFQDDENVNIVL